MLLEPLKHVQKNFEVDPSFVAKVMRLFFSPTVRPLRDLEKFQQIRKFHQGCSGVRTYNQGGASAPPWKNIC